MKEGELKSLFVLCCFFFLDTRKGEDGAFVPFLACSLMALELQGMWESQVCFPSLPQDLNPHLPELPKELGAMGMGWVCSPCCHLLLCARECHLIEGTAEGLSSQVSRHRVWEMFLLAEQRVWIYF